MRVCDMVVSQPAYAAERGLAPGEAWFSQAWGQGTGKSEPAKPATEVSAADSVASFAGLSACNENPRLGKLRLARG
jgi:hypothetical protein